MSDFKFGNIDHLKRDLKIEGETGTELGIEGGITLVVLAATEANPRWKARGEQVRAELNRLSNARADSKRVRDYLAGIYAECIVIGWRGVVDAEGREHVVGPVACGEVEEDGAGAVGLQPRGGAARQAPGWPSAWP